MRFFRLLAIGMVLLVLAGAILGMACTGVQGEEGPQGPKGDPGTDGVGVEDIVNNGDGTFTVNLTNGESYTTDNLTGPQGPQGETGDIGADGQDGADGEPGPNMIVAMGWVQTNGTVNPGAYNVTSCTWNGDSDRYEIALTGIDYAVGNYVTLATPVDLMVSCFAMCSSGSGKLFVYIHSLSGTLIQNPFSFMVLGAVP